jgi:hypothetical protein
MVQAITMVACGTVATFAAIDAATGFGILCTLLMNGGGCRKYHRNNDSLQVALPVDRGR